MQGMEHHKFADGELKDHDVAPFQKEVEAEAVNDEAGLPQGAVSIVLRDERLSRGHANLHHDPIVDR